MYRNTNVMVTNSENLDEALKFRIYAAFPKIPWPDRLAGRPPGYESQAANPVTEDHNIGHNY